MAGFWDGIGPVLVQTGASLIGGLFQNKANEEAIDEASDEKKKDRILQLQLAELAEKYKVGRGGGGGGGGGGTDRTASLLNAYQNYIASNRAARDRQSQAFQELGRAATAPLLRG